MKTRIAQAIARAMAATVLSAACVPFALAADDDVILTTRDFTVTERDFNYYLVEREIDEAQAKRVFAREGMVKNAIENIYVIKAFAAEGSRNTEIDMEEVDWLVNHYRERLLMNRHLDLVIDERLANVDWETAALEYYVANRASFNTAEQVDVDHILISLNDRSMEEAEARANEVLAKLQAGADFAAVAEEYSDDQGSASKGGRIGPFPRGVMVPPFEVAAFALNEPGELSEPVLSDFGYHIIKFNERIPSQPQSFETIKDRLLPELQKQRRQQVRDSLVAEVKSGQVDLGLEVNLPLLEAIEARYAPDPDPNVLRIREILQPGDDE